MAAGAHRPPTPARRAARVVLRLYVAGDAPNSVAARANLANALSSLSPGEARVEIVDVFDNPDAALQDAVFVTPMLVRRSPAPRVRVVGTLADRATVLQAIRGSDDDGADD